LLFLTEILGAEVVDVRQNRVGPVRDLTVRVEEPYPVVTGIVVSRHRERVIPWSAVRTYSAAAREASLRMTREESEAERGDAGGVWLARDVLDKQVVDTDGRRVVRVNDLQLVEVSSDLLLVGADVGVRGILRRLSLEGAGKSIARLFGRELPMKLVSWDVVEPIHDGVAGERTPAEDAVHLRISGSRIGRLHPADIADIVEDLGAKERRAVFATLEEEVAADTLEEMELDDQVSVIEHMDDQRAGEILEELPPDEAADILAALPQDRAEQILKSMEKEEAADVQELLPYGGKTAGGLMTTEFMAVAESLTAAECIAELRRLQPEAETAYYVYVIDPNEHPRGVVSLRDLILADPATPVEEFMVRNVNAVPVEADQDEVAAVLSKYNLVAVPVVDDEFRIQGVVSVDDVLDAVLPDSVKRRLPQVL
jgi:CBS domain-containing protein